jgi:hypothetical protein
MMIFVFCTSLGLLWWRARSPVSEAGMPAASAPSGLTAASPYTRPVVVGLGEAATAPPAAPEPLPKAQLEAAEFSDSNPNGPELPVVLGFIQKSDLFRDASTNYITARRRVNEGVLSNVAGQPLTVTIVDTDVAKRLSTETIFDMNRGAQLHFGQRDGLTMASGDLITLKSPHYRTFTQRVP